MNLKENILCLKGIYYRKRMLDSLFEKKGIYGGKTIKVQSHVLHTEIPFGQDKSRPVRYANFVIE